MHALASTDPTVDVAIPSTVTISSTGPFAVCINITTVEDTVLEGNQTFIVGIDSTNPSINIDTASFLEVTIIDNEGLFITWYAVCVLSKLGRTILIIHLFLKLLIFTCVT